jgi:hypothetical protein
LLKITVNSMQKIKRPTTTDGKKKVKIAGT